MHDITIEIEVANVFKILSAYFIVPATIIPPTAFAMNEISTFGSKLIETHALNYLHGCNQPNERTITVKIALCTDQSSVLQ